MGAMTGRDAADEADRIFKNLSDDRERRIERKRRQHKGRRFRQMFREDDPDA